MLLFDIIRDWFVMYIWGGWTSTGDNYFTHWGMGYLFFDNEFDSEYGLTGNDINCLKLHDIVYGLGGDNYLTYSISDWLSTTSTIIVMILLCVVFGLMVRWLFRLTAGLLRGN